MSQARIFQISVSNGGVPKLPVQQAEITINGLVGDHQAHPNAHGGPERAVCLYSLERILELQAEGNPAFPGSLGENLTLSGVDWDKIKPGMRLQVGSEVELEITRYTTPCNEITPSFKDRDSNRILQDRFPGWSRVYARVVKPGSVKIGDLVAI